MDFIITGIRHLTVGSQSVVQELTAIPKEILHKHCATKFGKKSINTFYTIIVLKKISQFVSTLCIKSFKCLENRKVTSGQVCVIQLKVTEQLLYLVRNCFVNCCFQGQKQTFNLNSS